MVCNLSPLVFWNSLLWKFWSILRLVSKQRYLLLPYPLIADTCWNWRKIRDLWKSKINSSCFSKAYCRTQNIVGPFCEPSQTTLSFPGYGKGNGNVLGSLPMLREAKELFRDVGPIPEFPSVTKITWQAVVLPHSPITTLLIPCSAVSMQVLSYSSIFCSFDLILSWSLVKGQTTSYSEENVIWNVAFFSKKISR